ncbi:hypothetical protein C1Y63_08720 [Corynebacterium sp. 13CS0277]|uniref:DUF6286 domain-containing protein n=1 Tax=Corynebacterium sp. 13CS0277 TaxID=2071994 RepID=UPI000D03C48D|nr:DUF6286 domain-containing protein [Corynebacterium sp. 13CS0277]PRQ10937.1 hypothetical protein C1Y63_08720 [Corynebacterium sp. 13CS0277]
MSDTPTQPAEAVAPVSAHADTTHSVATPDVPTFVREAPTPRPPAASPVARYIAILIGLLLVVGGVLAIREYWLFTDSGEGISLLKETLDHAGRASFEPWMFPTGIIGVMVGVLLLYLAVRPRTKTHRRLRGNVHVFVRPVDVARLCTAHAEKAPGVLKAHTVATQRTVTVSVTGDPSDATLQPRLEALLQPMLGELDPAPQLKVKLNRKGEQ